MAMSSAIPAPLTPAECPLLVKYAQDPNAAAELVQRYNQSVERLQNLQRGEYAALLAREDFVQEVVGLLEDIRQRLTRTKYVVGCIGITQAGKSTVVNSVLGDEICKPGAMDACSSLPSRIVKADHFALDLEYLTPKQFEQRLHRLCQEALGLSTVGDLDKDIVPYLDKAEYFRKEGVERPRLQDDLKYLKGLIEAYKRRGKQVLTDPPRRESNLPYEQRYAYTTHGGGRGQDALLLREARFRVKNSYIPDDLELCDLPGLDSKRTIDDIVTWEYLSQLDGAFLFVNAASNFLTEGMLKALCQVMQVFDHKLTDRAWVIFNKMDTLTPDSFRDGANENIFHTIERFLERSQLPASQVCFTAKRIWENALRNKGRANLEQACDFVGQTPERPIPACCPENMRSAWEELLKDGGISYLRRLIFEHVARSVAAEVRQDVERKLKRFHEKLEQHLQAEELRRRLDPEALRNIQTCYSEVIRLQRDLLLRWRNYTAARSVLDTFREQQLKNIIDSLERENLEYSSQDEIARLVDTNARLIERLLKQCLHTGLVFQRAYEEIRTQLEKLPTVRWGNSQETCESWWQRISDEDRAHYAEWLGNGQDLRFITSELESWLQGRLDLPGGAGLTSSGFLRDRQSLRLLQERLDSVFDYLDQKIRSRLRYRLRQLSGELSLLVDEHKSGSDGPPAK